MGVVGALALGAALAPSPAVGADGQVTYTPSTASFANPERGFYRHSGDCDKQAFSVSTLTSFRTSGNSALVMCIFYLAEFKNAPISAAKLAWFQQQADVVRAAGLKMVLRFAYTKSTAGDDAPLATVLGHIHQLAPYLRANSDVIDVVQSGFVGAWGEGYYTQNFGDRGVVTATDWKNRKAVVTRLLNVLPTTRMVQVRTPAMKRQMFGTSPVSSSAAYGGSGLARVGHHNDCFLASSTDFGTFQDPAVEYPYLAADTTYVASGGETCGVNPPRSDCPTALHELALFHYGYLNRDYHPSVLGRWTTGGCLTQIEQRLGYRFSLVASLLPATVTRGNTMLVQFAVANRGWSTPCNPRPVWLLLRNTASGSVVRVQLSADPRRSTPGATTMVAQTVGVPATLKPGAYEVLLSLPDPAAALKSRPEYAIRFANSGVWEPSTGYNRLLTTLIVN